MHRPPLPLLENLMSKISYDKVGDNYGTKDPIKRLAQNSALKTAVNLKKSGYREISDTRGESAFVLSLGKNLPFIASVTESLGTKNLIADEMRNVSGKTYYDIVAHDTVASIINDLITVGARPLSIHAFWAVETNDWLYDKKRMRDLVSGWKKAVDMSGAAWGGGETPTLKGIIHPNTVDLAGSAVGIVDSEKRLITSKKLTVGDRILLLKSNGINANGISLARAVAKRIPKGYATKLNNGKFYGEELLTKTNIYAKVVQELLDANINIHYISNITGHGLRKIMRAKQNFSYIVENIFDPEEIFLFIQKQAKLSDKEIYQVLNMGSDYAIFLPAGQVAEAKKIIEENNFEALDAGYVEKGKRRVVIKPKNIEFFGSSLRLS